MRYGHNDLDGYMGGGVFGEFDSDRAMKTGIKVGVAGIASFAYAFLEGSQVTEVVKKDEKGAVILGTDGKPIKTGEKILGGEIKLGGKVPLPFVIAGGLFAASLFDAGDYIGLDSDYIEAAGLGVLNVWTTNRGHEKGMGWRKDKDKTVAYTKASMGATPRGLRGNSQVAHGGGQQRQTAQSPWQR